MLVPLFHSVRSEKHDCTRRYESSTKKYYSKIEPSFPVPRPRYWIDCRRSSMRRAPCPLTARSAHSSPKIKNNTQLDEGQLTVLLSSKIVTKCYCVYKIDKTYTVKLDLHRHFTKWGNHDQRLQKVGQTSFHTAVHAHRTAGDNSRGIVHLCT